MALAGISKLLPGFYMTSKLRVVFTFVKGCFVFKEKAKKNIQHKPFMVAKPKIFTVRLFNRKSLWTPGLEHTIQSNDKLPRTVFNLCMDPWFYLSAVLLSYSIVLV